MLKKKLITQIKEHGAKSLVWLEMGKKNYRKFTREETIADLEYYYEHTKKQYIDILTLKNGWKKEEYDAKRFRVSIFFPFSDTHGEILENVAGAERRTRDRLVQR